jgi:hypothetical protein
VSQGLHIRIWNDDLLASYILCCSEQFRQYCAKQRCPYLHYDKFKHKTYHASIERNTGHNSTLPLTLALDGGWMVKATLRVLSPKNDCYPLCRQLGGRQGPSGRVRKMSPSTGFDPRTFKPVASYYIANTISDHKQQQHSL